MTRGVPVALGLAAIVVVAVGVPVALARHSDAAPTVRVAPLTATDRRVLTASRPLIEALPAAIAEIPQAASAAAGHRVTAAAATTIINDSAGLAPLARALRDPASVTGELVASYRAVLAGRRTSSPDQLAADLERLQSVEGQIGPAVRLVAAKAGRQLSAADALTAIERNAAARPLAALVGDWQQVYGTVTLLEQQAAT